MPKINYKNMNFYQIDDKKVGILLRYSEDKNKSLSWIGNMKLKQNSNEKPLILKFNNNNVYFYANGIQEINNEDLNKNWIDSNNNQSRLTDIEQKEAINALDKNIDHNNLNQKITFLEIKTEYLEQENQNLKVEKEDLEFKNELSEEYNNVRFKTDDLVLTQEDTSIKAIQKMHKQLINLQYDNTMLQKHIDILCKTKDNLCEDIGRSLEAHEYIAEKTEEFFNKEGRFTKKGRPSRKQFKSFIKNIGFVNQAAFDKFNKKREEFTQEELLKEKTKDFKEEDKYIKYTRMIKNYYDKNIQFDIGKIERLNKNAKHLKNEKILKNINKMEIIEEEHEFE